MQLFHLILKIVLLELSSVIAYKFEFQFKTPYYTEIEDYIHEKYGESHEWVKVGLNEIIAVIKNYKHEI